MGGRGSQLMAHDFVVHWPQPVHTRIIREVVGTASFGDPARMVRTYAGIGNRDIEPQTNIILWETGRNLAQLGWKLRSGGAKGSDQAFANGAHNGEGEVEELKANDATEESIKTASNYHPAWDKCSDHVKKLHGRNAQIILGRDLRSYVTFVLCYAKSEARGGTAVGIRIARAHGIPVINLCDPQTIEDIIREYPKP